jgi:hypothetical protein
MILIKLPLPLWHVVPGNHIALAAIKLNARIGCDQETLSWLHAGVALEVEQ